MILHDVLSQLSTILIMVNEFVSIATIFEHDSVECAKNDISLEKNEQHKTVNRYGQFIAKNRKVMSIFFNNISFSLKMFVINEKSILNFLDRHFETDILNMSSAPRN